MPVIPYVVFVPKLVIDPSVFSILLLNNKDVINSLLTFWFLKETKFGKIVGVVAVPVVSYLPTHMPFNSSVPNVKPGAVNQLPFVVPVDLVVFLFSKTIWISFGDIELPATLNN